MNESKEPKNHENRMSTLVLFLLGKILCIQTKPNTYDVFMHWYYR